MFQWRERNWKITWNASKKCYFYAKWTNKDEIIKTLLDTQDFYPGKCIKTISRSVEEEEVSQTRNKARSLTEVDSLHLKVKENICLTKNYCITISIQNISSIHKLILKIRADFRVSWTKRPHFRPRPPKNFQLYWICIRHARNQFLQSVHPFEIQSILQPCYQTGHTHFWSCPPPKNFWSAFNFCESV